MSQLDLQESTGATGAAASPVRLLYWSVRRELWENRSLYLAPLAAAAVFLLGFLVSMGRLTLRVRALQPLSPSERHNLIAQPYDMAAGLLMITAMLVGMFYSLDALYGERRDRCILFWKSLPVSDQMTVLSKATIPILVLPLITFAITFALHSMMLLTSSLVLWASGVSDTNIWQQLSFPRMSLLLLYHLLTVHALWQAPLYAWLLLISAWARRAPILWGVLPPVALGTLERFLFHTSHFANFLEYRIGGDGAEAFTMPGTFPMDPMTHPTPGLFLLSPGLWIGLGITALFLAMASWLRHRRESG